MSALWRGCSVGVGLFLKSLCLFGNLLVGGLAAKFFGQDPSCLLLERGIAACLGRAFLFGRAAFPRFLGGILLPGFLGAAPFFDGRGLGRGKTYGTSAAIGEIVVLLANRGIGSPVLGT